MKIDTALNLCAVAKRYREASRIEQQAELAVSIPLRLRLEAQAREMRRKADDDYDAEMPAVAIHGAIE